MALEWRTRRNRMARVWLGYYVMRPSWATMRRVLRACTWAGQHSVRR